MQRIWTVGCKLGNFYCTHRMLKTFMILLCVSSLCCITWYSRTQYNVTVEQTPTRLNSTDFNKNAVKNKTIQVFHSSTMKFDLGSTEQTTKDLPRQCDFNWQCANVNSTHYENKPSRIRTMSRTNQIVKLIFDNPVIYLDPTKFLSPVLRWGPNNQVIGFHESIYMSILLNRTVVLPRFYKHKTDKQKSNRRNFVSPNHRIDIEEICRFVSCITLETFQRVCGFQVDVVLNTRKLSMVDVRSMEVAIGMQFLSKEETNIKKLTKMLHPYPALKKQHDRRYTQYNLKKLFGVVKQKCAIYPYPFLDIRTKTRNGRYFTAINKMTETVPKGNFSEISSMTESRYGYELHAAIAQHYKRPAYIRKLASEFINNSTNGEPFLGVHWRYDANDFFEERNCNKKEKYEKICRLAKQFTYKTLSERIYKKIKLLNRTQQNLRHVYIASPPIDAEMIANVTIFLGKKGLFIHSASELVDFMNYRHGNCEKLFERYFDEIVTTTEMEICSRGVAFLKSMGTTLTDNIVRTRIFGNISGIQPELDEYVFKIE